MLLLIIPAHGMSAVSHGVGLKHRAAGDESGKQSASRLRSPAILAEVFCLLADRSRQARLMTVIYMPTDEIKVAIFDATYNGKEWYRCPYCRKTFEYYDTLYSEGFRKIADGVFVHIPCGGKIKIV